MREESGYEGVFFTPTIITYCSVFQFIKYKIVSRSCGVVPSPHTKTAFLHPITDDLLQDS